MARPPTPAPAAARPAETLINGQFRVDIARPLPGAGGGLSAFAVSDQRDGQIGLMAVQVRRHLPVREHALQSLAGSNLDGLLTPLAYGVAATKAGEEAGFLICRAPPGPALAATLRPWAEAELLSLVLRPVARVLDQLHQRGLSHRAIRADNVFRAGPGHPVTLGCAWATPPAALQPAVAEPPYVAICRPGARGDGSIADDVYALGVLMLTLALGRAPLAGVDEAEIIRRKLDQGSHAALLGEHRVGHFVGDLLRGMLAEDPEHRPPPTLLLDPAAARSRRTAARPPHRAPRPIEVGDVVCWHPRMLAHALATQPEVGLRALRTGAVGQWLRRGLGDGALAVRLDEQLGLRGTGLAEEAGGEDSVALMRAVATLDQLAPLCWNGLNLWPDAIGTTLAEAMQDPAAPANAETAAQVAGLVGVEAQTAWTALRPDRANSRRLRMDARQVHALLHLPGAAGGLIRLTYQLNPLLPCVSPDVGARWVSRLAELLPVLEATAQRDRALARPIGAGIAAFIAARGDRGLEPLVSRLGDLYRPGRSVGAATRAGAVAGALPCEPVAGAGGLGRRTRGGVARPVAQPAAPRRTAAATARAGRGGAARGAARGCWTTSRPTGATIATCSRPAASLRDRHYAGATRRRRTRARRAGAAPGSGDRRRPRPQCAGAAAADRGVRLSADGKAARHTRRRVRGDRRRRPVERLAVAAGPVVRRVGRPVAVDRAVAGRAAGAGAAGAVPRQASRASRARAACCCARSRRASRRCACCGPPGTA